MIGISVFQIPVFQIPVNSTLFIPRATSHRQVVSLLAYVSVDQMPPVTEAAVFFSRAVRTRKHGPK
jgi:hypothetical protein